MKWPLLLERINNVIGRLWIGEYGHNSYTTFMRLMFYYLCCWTAIVSCVVLHFFWHWYSFSPQTQKIIENLQGSY